MSLLLSQTELADLSRSPRQQLSDALARGNWDETQAVWADLRGAYFDLLTLFRTWVASLQEFILNTYGREALADASRLDAVVAGMLARAITVGNFDAGSEHHPDAVQASLAARDASGVLVAFDATEPGIRQVHDYLRDWISTYLSWVYRTHGLDALDRALRHSSELLWMPWMMEDVTHPAVQRVRDWARLLKANFATIRVEEDAEKFVLIQDPCGSCGRQHREGRYEGPAALAMIAEPHPLTFMRGGVTAYRTHIAIMHYIMPIERIGAPWPAIECPFTKDGVCRLVLYKDARRAAPDHYRRVGLPAPA
jgi:hypothetical protein